MVATNAVFVTKNGVMPRSVFNIKFALCRVR